MTLSKEYENLKSPPRKSHKDINEENFRSLSISASCLLTTVLSFRLLLAISQKTLSNRQPWRPKTLVSNGWRCGGQ